MRHIEATALDVTARSRTGFDDLWDRCIAPMARTTIERVGGGQMLVLEVDGAGIQRVTSKGERQRIPIDNFRWAIDRLLAGEIVTRQVVRDRHAGRFASGVMDILAAIPDFEAVKLGRGRAVRMRAA